MQALCPVKKPTIKILKNKKASKKGKKGSLLGSLKKTRGFITWPSQTFLGHERFRKQTWTKSRLTGHGRWEERGATAVFRKGGQWRSGRTPRQEGRIRFTRRKGNACPGGRKTWEAGKETAFANSNSAWAQGNRAGEGKVIVKNLVRQGEGKKKLREMIGHGIVGRDGTFSRLQSGRGESGAKGKTDVERIWENERRRPRFNKRAKSGLQSGKRESLNV